MTARISRQPHSGGSKDTQQLPLYKTLRYQTFYPGFDIFIKPFIYFIGHFAAFCIGFLGYKGLTNRRFGSIIRYRDMRFGRFEGLGV
jgi:hypothetical protein